MGHQQDLQYFIKDGCVSPAQIVMGGFFFIVECDRVKCWYCNGGLHNWECMDDPGVEHAKFC